ncbi:MAG TPA: hypothetical protein VFO66_15050 [Gemmatimonadaceae bacterium]|nr:hypothetical protein [Gemmatimonadaceae bacterium]
MTGIEIAVVIAVGAFVVVGVISVGGMVIERHLRNVRRQRIPFELTDFSVLVTRPVVLVGQNCDIRFYFTVKNPRGLQLSYEARVLVDEIANVPPQQNGFAIQHFRTEVPRLHCKWNSVGTKKVTALVTVHGRGMALNAQVQGSVEVVAELDQE